MLSLWKLRVGAEAYYLSQVARGIDDYYSGSGESEGRWLGTGSAILNLADAVTGDDLRIATRRWAIGASFGRIRRAVCWLAHLHEQSSAPLVERPHVARNASTLDQYRERVFGTTYHVSRTYCGSPGKGNPCPLLQPHVTLNGTLPSTARWAIERFSGSARSCPCRCLCRNH